MANLSCCKHVLLTGPPGVGKTTLVKKVAKKIAEKCLFSLSGFYTEELRERGSRIGFDIVLIDQSKRACLSRKRDYLPAAMTKSTPMVGQYCVDVESFEEIAIPALHLDSGNSQLVVIDEIGKMELLSSKFRAQVYNNFGATNAVIFATVPLSKGKPLEMVDNLKRRPDCKVIMVTKLNRDGLVDEICDTITHSLAFISS